MSLGRTRIAHERTGYGDASACLKERTPLTRRDLPLTESKSVPTSVGAL